MCRPDGSLLARRFTAVAAVSCGGFAVTVVRGGSAVTVTVTLPPVSLSADPPFRVLLGLGFGLVAEAPGDELRLGDTDTDTVGAGFPVSAEGLGPATSSAPAARVSSPPPDPPPPSITSGTMMRVATPSATGPTTSGRCSRPGAWNSSSD